MDFLQAKLDHVRTKYQSACASCEEIFNEEQPESDDDVEYGNDELYLEVEYLGETSTLNTDLEQPGKPFVQMALMFLRKTLSDAFPVVKHEFESNDGDTDATSEHSYKDFEDDSLALPQLNQVLGVQRVVYGDSWLSENPLPAENDSVFTAKDCTVCLLVSSE